MKVDNSVYVLSRYIKLLGIPITNLSISVELLKHPNHRSLYALSDLLDQWNVPNGSYNVELSDLPNIDAPFIAHLSSRKGEFAVIEHVGDDYFIVTNERWRSLRISVDNFKRIFTGFVLVAKNDKSSGEPEYKKNRRKEVVTGLRIPVVISGLTIIFLSTALHVLSSWDYNWHIGLLLMIKFVGVITTTLLLIQSIDSNNWLVAKICSGGKRNNCNSILSSEEANVTDELNWSEVGFFYFAGSLLTFFFFASGPIVSILAAINLFTLPFTFYSIYFQRSIARTWCTLCCVVQGLLWAEFVIFLPYLSLSSGLVSGQSLGNVFIGFSIPVLLWMFVKPLILKSRKTDVYSEQLAVLKYKMDFFPKTLHAQKKHSLPPESESIVLGNIDSKNVITIVSNPFCQPCSQAHRILREWLSIKDVKVQVVFYVSNQERDNKSKVARHMMALNKLGTPELIERAMHDWYELKQSYEIWSKRYWIEDEKIDGEQISKHIEWCRNTNVKGTPTILINGYKLHKSWSLDDIKYMV